MSNSRGRRRSDWQREAEKELYRVAKALPDDFAIRERLSLHPSGLLRAEIRLRTADLLRRSGGLPLKDHENFVLWIRSGNFPPIVEVEHNRFIKFPHVINGRQICIYLDASREWSPQHGISQAIDRLYDWLGDAAANRFNPQTSLYHAVGGLNYSFSDLPMIVARDACPPNRAFSGYLTQRTDHRYDLYFERTNDDQLQVPSIALSTPLPLGIGHTFIEVLARLDDPLGDSWLGIPCKPPPQSPAFLTALAASACRMKSGTAQAFILTVPHPTGGPPHILAGVLSPEVADMMRQLVKIRDTNLIEICAESFSFDTPVEWCPVSDERASVTTRRDESRPINAFYGKTIHVWGCGGLGSWIAEFIARSGAKKLVLCDPGVITGGLLVRQNFTELDVGSGKAKALRQRILAIRDDIEVDAYSDNIPKDLTTFDSVDVVIDATISHMIGQVLDSLAPLEPRPIFAQVATDVKTGTLGILSVSAPGTLAGSNEVDRKVGQIVLADGQLESFHTFWTEVNEGDELVPTRGCSVPTFHGSAADMAALAASLTSLLGSHVSATEPISGAHLIALPHSPTGPFHQFVRLN